MITLGGGCFWCTEAVFSRLKGVVKVISGYAGGEIQNPDYSQVSSGMTGHAEAVQIEYEPMVITLETILEVFFAIHDPTTLNQQGGDFGTQYRSIIFYRNKDQKNTAKKFIKSDYVTELVPFSNFYPAEDYHQNYYENNKNNPYCQLIINPKLDKLVQEFSRELK